MSEEYQGLLENMHAKVWIIIILSSILLISRATLSERIPLSFLGLFHVGSGVTVSAAPG